MLSNVLNNNRESGQVDDHSEVLVRVRGVSKKFCRNLKKSLWYGIKDVTSEFLPFRKRISGIGDQVAGTAEPSSVRCGLGLRPGEFWANKNISFELRRGECIGLLGRNGAGKTTLLKLLNGLIKPDEGTIEIHGRVGALIALGAGFNPILSGRENIYVNGAVLGLTREEINSKIIDIIDFAELHDFIDSPVQTYSSGMQVRLGFAVATALEPDILILDEVLAVGDIVFREKCLSRIHSMLEKCAVIFVSHNQSQVDRICDLALFLAKGEQVYFGDTATALRHYNQVDGRGNVPGLRPIVTVFPPIKEANVFPERSRIKAGGELCFQASLRFDGGIAISHYAILIRDSSSHPVAHVSKRIVPIQVEEGCSLLITIAHLDLQAGEFSMDLVVSMNNGKTALLRYINCMAIIIDGSGETSCPYQPTSSIQVVSNPQSRL